VQIAFAIALCLLLPASAIGRAPPESASPADGPMPLRPSLIKLPVELPLGPMLREIEQLTPKEAGHWRTWRGGKGIGTRYRAWRGPLSFTASGESLVVQAHVRYWVQARADLLGALEVEASCGVDEPPRQAVIGLAVRLAWGADWSLRPQFRILPTRFIDRCEMTLADLDVTPIIGQVFDQELRESVLAALASRRKQLAQFRTRVAQGWARLQEPIQVGPAAWLLLRPFAAALAPPRVESEHVSLLLGLALQPRLEYGARPAGEALPLPALGALPASAEGLAFHVSLVLDWPTLSDLLSTALADQRIAVQGRNIGIGGVQLAAKGAELEARVRLTGDAPGRVDLWIEPVLEPGPQPLRFATLDYLYHADDPADSLLADAFYIRIRQALLDSANDLLARHLGRLQERIQEAVERVLPKSVGIDLDEIELRSGRLRVQETGLDLTGTAAGRLRLSYRGAARR